MAERLEDAIEHTPDTAMCGQSQWPIDCYTRLGKTAARPTRRLERLSGLIHLNWLTNFKSGEGDWLVFSEFRTSIPVIAQEARAWRIWPADSLMDCVPRNSNQH
jgi:hypothetical protein